MKKKFTISVVTATWNAENHLPRLIESIRNQTDKDFNWIVADGLSTDGTLNILKELKDIRLQIISKSDFGIYDALNRGIKLAKSDYYLVVGADDYLDPRAVENYRRVAIEAGGPDIVASAVKVGENIITPKSGLGWFYGMPGVASSHSVGLLIKCSLHDRFGFYSRKLPIAADQLFIKTVLMKNGSIVRCDFVSGEFSKQGVSGQDDWGLITELFRVQIETERWMFLQLMLLVLRCLKCYLSKLLFKKQIN